MYTGHLWLSKIAFCHICSNLKNNTKKANSMQELQCVDCIVNFLETEKDLAICDYTFNLLFDDMLYHQHASKFVLQLLLSYAISLEAQKTLECVSKWIISNIGNEIIQYLFDQLIKDHFLLAYEPDEDKPQDNLVNLCQISPQFASLFMTILLDMLSRDLIKCQEKCLKKGIYIFVILFILYGVKF